MQPYMDRLSSVGKRFIRRLIVDDIAITQVGSYEEFINSKQGLPWQIRAQFAEKTNTFQGFINFIIDAISKG